MPYLLLPFLDRRRCCCLPLPAGKVHGSLARAGKVRGQTPKVPKQEKKKQVGVEQASSLNALHVACRYT